MLRLLGRGNFQVMPSLSEKISRAGAPSDDLMPRALRLSRRRPILVDNPQRLFGFEPA
jgi:hypothetical protein